jgi:flavin-dependent dehydrogenase
MTSASTNGARGTNYDAIVVGARCAGSPVAMRLAQMGHSVLLLDRDEFPSDCISTHFIHPRGVDRLEGWGLLQRVLDTNAPPILNQAGLADGTFQSTPFGKKEDGSDIIALCPRRTVLDKILVDAAVEAGATFQGSTSVQDVLRDDDGTVVGVSGRHDGDPFEATARLVIGADGIHSRIARAVDAEQYERVDTLLFAYYAYFSGVEGAGIEAYIGSNGGALMFNTNDDQVCIGAGLSIGNLEEFRKDIEGNFKAALEASSSELAERVANGKRESDFRGMADLPHFKMQAGGPGWMLVGDAGYHVDPILGFGISNAWDHVELAADAAHAVLNGDATAEEAMPRYQQQRDEALQPFWDANLEFSRVATSGAAPTLPGSGH